MGEPLEQLLSELSLSCHQPELRDAFFADVMRALDAYGELRAGTSGHPLLVPCRIHIFSSLWAWYDDLKRSQRPRVFDRVLDVHLTAAARPGAGASKVEFAFLAGWSQSLEWAAARNLRSAPAFARVAEQLLDLCTAPVEVDAVATFFGRGRRHSTAWTAFDGDDDIDLLGMPATFYERHVMPRRDELAAGLAGFASGD